MVKRTIKETIREYDEDGRLMRETVTETEEDDNSVYFPYAQNPYFIFPPAEKPSPWWSTEPTCTCNTSEIKQ